MSRLRVFAFLTLATAVLAISGCHSGGRRSAVGGEPALSGLDAEDKAYLDAPAARQETVVDRHPLFAKPREYWENSGDNRIVKAAAATFVGVPVGFVGEVKQIFVGAPPTVVTAPTTHVTP
ncbi:hypothetical protein [Paludisphaera mucosa]|uniref:Uncharacterized protein n=1 Tax=Paludisphaera mucosa TaxID=3030827 RepID=A0ABT6F8H1_9BACT|nr:hypothetical protein [Paludisphaera mucosa]MDG3003892.1 hypothetical protein [Paludisphaera mucosa]